MKSNMPLDLSPCPAVVLIHNYSHHCKNDPVPMFDSHCLTSVLDPQERDMLRPDLAQRLKSL